MSFLDKVKDMGVVGAGGAGFPTHVKLNAKAATFIVNGIECEPLLETDKYLMRHYAKELVMCADKVGKHLCASRTVIAVKNYNIKEIAALKQAVKDSCAAVEIFETENYYPAGDEQMLLREISGVTLVPGDIPLTKGIVVSNVATLLDIYSDSPVIKRLVTVTGMVKNPTLVRVAVGASVADCIELAGGSILDDYAVILGGPMMGRDYDKKDTFGQVVTKTLGGIIVLPKDHELIIRRRLSMGHIIKRAASACIQCRFCTDLCPRYTNGHPLYPHKVMRAIGNSEKNMDAYESALLCCECGICELYACPMGLSPKTVNQFVKKELMKNGYKRVNKPGAEYEPDLMRESRKVPTQRLVDRTNLADYKTGMLDDVVDYTPHKVVIPLKQHIGVACRPVVKNGDTVKTGDLIGTVAEGSLGAYIHASIDGRVTLLDGAVEIQNIN